MTTTSPSRSQTLSTQPQPSIPTVNNATVSEVNDTADLFDDLLTLEDRFYNQGYEQGLVDGIAAGRAEGRQIGLERGFQRFLEAGRLQGKAIVWACRLRAAQKIQGKDGVGEGIKRNGVEAGPREGDREGQTSSQQQTLTSTKEDQLSSPTTSSKPNDSSNSQEYIPPSRIPLPPLISSNPRIERHITSLYALSETESLSVENTDEAVDAFDGRMKRAQGKVKLIERIIHEEKITGTNGEGSTNGGQKGRRTEIEEGRDGNAGRCSSQTRGV